MATHHRHKRGHTPQIQKRPKRPTLNSGVEQNVICYINIVDKINDKQVMSDISSKSKGVYAPSM